MVDISTQNYTGKKIRIDPTWPSVKEKLDDHIKYLKEQGNEEEYLEAQKRYEGLKASEVSIEPYALIEGKTRKVCIAIRKTGRARFDIEVEAKTIQDILLVPEGGFPFATVETVDEMHELYLSGGVNQTIHCTENGRTYILVNKVDDLSNPQTLENHFGQYGFDFAQPLPFSLRPEGDFAFGTLKLRDEALVGGEIDCYIIDAESSDEYIRHKNFLVLTEAGDVREVNELETGDAINAETHPVLGFDLVGYDPKYHLITAVEVIGSSPGLEAPAVQAFKIVDNKKVLVNLNLLGPFNPIFSSITVPRKGGELSVTLKVTSTQVATGVTQTHEVEVDFMLNIDPSRFDLVATERLNANNVNTIVMEIVDGYGVIVPTYDQMEFSYTVGGSFSDYVPDETKHLAGRVNINNYQPGTIEIDSGWRVMSVSVPIEVKKTDIFPVTNSAVLIEGVVRVGYGLTMGGLPSAGLHIEETLYNGSNLFADDMNLYKHVQPTDSTPGSFEIRPLVLNQPGSMPAEFVGEYGVKVPGGSDVVRAEFKAPYVSLTNGAEINVYTKGYDHPQRKFTFEFSLLDVGGKPILNPHCYTPLRSSNGVKDPAVGVVITDTATPGVYLGTVTLKDDIATNESFSFRFMGIGQSGLQMAELEFNEVWPAAPTVVIGDESVEIEGFYPRGNVAYSFSVKTTAGQPAHAIGIVTPVTSVTNSTGGTLVPVSAVYDETTGFARVVFDSVIDHEANMEYTLKLDITDDLGRAVPVTVSMTTIGDHEFWAEPSHRVVGPGTKLVATWAIKGKRTEVVKGDISTLSGTMIGLNPVHSQPSEQSWDNVNKIETGVFTILSVDTPAVVDVDVRMFANTNYVTDTYIKCPTDEMRIGVNKVAYAAGVLTADLVCRNSEGNPIENAIIRSFSVTSQEPDAQPTLVAVADKPGYYTLSVAVVKPVTDVVNYTAQFELSVSLDALTTLVGAGSFSHVGLIDPEGKTPKIISTSADFINNEVLIEMELAFDDGSAILNADLVVPFRTALLTDSGTKTPRTMTYNPETGRLSFMFQMSYDPYVENEFTFESDIAFPWYSGDMVLPFSWNETKPALKHLSIVETNSEILDGGSAVKVTFQASSSDLATGFPQDVTLHVPFHRTVNTLRDDGMPEEGPIYDNATGIGHFTFLTKQSVQGPVTVHMDTIGGCDGYKSLDLAFSKEIPQLVGYQLNKVSTVVDNGVLTGTYQVVSTAGLPAAVSVTEFDTFTNTVGGTKTPTSQSYDPATGVWTFSIPVTAPSLTQTTTYTYTGTVALDSSTEALDETVLVYGMTATVSSAVAFGNKMTVKFRLVRSDGQNATGVKVATILDIPEVTQGSEVLTDQSLGQYELNAGITIPTPAPASFTGRVRYVYTTSTGTYVGYIPFTATALLAWPSGNPTYTQDAKTVVKDNGDWQVFLNVKLGDGTIPANCVIKNPLDNVSNIQGSDLSPRNQSYNPATGQVYFEQKTYVSIDEDRTHLISGDLTFPGYEGGLHNTHFVASVLRPRRPRMTATVVTSELNPARTQMKLTYQLASEDSVLPLNAAMQVPFENATPTGGIYSPLSQNYDPATGIGDFTFPVNLSTTADTTVRFVTNFTEPRYPVLLAELKVIVKLDVDPRATYIGSSIVPTGNRIRLNYNLATPGGAHPATATIGDLTKATGALSASPVAQGYDASTGNFWYEMSISPVINGKTTIYEMVGAIQAGGTPIQIGQYIQEYTLTPTIVSTYSTDPTIGVVVRTFYSIKANAESVNTKGLTVSSVSCTNEDTGRQRRITEQADGRLEILIPVRPSDPKVSETFTTQGGIVMVTAEKLSIPMAFSINARSYITPGSGVVNGALQSMTLVGGVLTTEVKFTWTGGPADMGVYGGVPEVPFSFASNTTPSGNKTPISSVWDNVNGVYRFTFNVDQPSAGNGGEYRFIGRVNFPGYQSYTSDEFEVFKVFQLPEQITAATYLDSTLINDVLTSRYELKAPNGTRPATATMARMDSTLNAIDDSSLAIDSQAYNPATGIFTFGVKVKKVGLNTTLPYRMIGTVTTDKGESLKLDRQHTSHSYTLTQGTPKWVTERLEVTQGIIRTSDETAVNNCTFIVGDLPKGVPGKVPYTTHQNNAVPWVTYLIVDLPAATGKTLYTGNGYLVVNQADGLKVHLQWALNFDSDPYPVNAVRTIELWDITWGAGLVNFFLKVQDPGLVNVSNAVVQTPMAKVLVPSNYDPAVPVSQSYDQATGLVKLAFNSAGPDAIPRDYMVQGTMKFPDVSATEKQDFYCIRLMNNKMDPNGTR